MTNILCLLIKASRTAGVYNSRQTGGSLHGTTFCGFCTVPNKTNYKNIYFKSKDCLGSSWRFFILQQLLRCFYKFTVILQVVCMCSSWSLAKLTCAKTSYQKQQFSILSAWWRNWGQLKTTFQSWRYLKCTKEAQYHTPEHKNTLSLLKIGSTWNFSTMAVL